MNNTIVPTKDTELLAWLAQRQQPWRAGATIGLSAAELTAFATASTAAQDAWTQWQAAKQAAIDASDAWKNAKKAARTAASNGVKSIRNFAGQQADPQKIYGAAMVPAPKSPNFGVPPGQPGNVTVALDVATGALDVRFECNNPPGLSGTVYVVNRRSGSVTGQFGPWTQVAITSTKRFVDNTLLAGTPSVQYQITAQRGSIVGAPSLPVTVTFGRAGNGPGMTVSVGSGEFGGRLAA